MDGEVIRGGRGWGKLASTKTDVKGGGGKGVTEGGRRGARG